MAPAVTRYRFPTPEWTRTIWVSADAREQWTPRLTAIGRAWTATEVLSVGAFRSTALLFVEPSELPALSHAIARRGLALMVLQQSGSGAAYQAGPVPVTAGRPWTYRVAVSVPAAATRFLDAWTRGDNDQIGALLGYPDCCRRFFERVWVRDGWIDTTWEMATGGLIGPGDPVVVHGPVEANILGRWTGTRWVPHLPCRFDCEATVQSGRAYRTILSEIAPEAARWLDLWLDQSWEWSAYHGIAELVTDVCKVSTKTDATVERLVVRRPGVTVQPLRFATRRAPAVWLQNGFSSADAMREAHGWLLAAVREAVALPSQARVVDLGCGTGDLLKALGDVDPAGVEQDAARSATAARAGVWVVHGTIADVLPQVEAHGPYALALMSENRLDEMGPAPAAAVLRQLEQMADVVVLYRYETRTTRVLRRSAVVQ